eukprot:gene10628-4345_t
MPDPCYAYDEARAWMAHAVAEQRERMGQVRETDDADPLADQLAAVTQLRTQLPGKSAPAKPTNAAKRVKKAVASGKQSTLSAFMNPK